VSESIFIKKTSFYYTPVKPFSTAQDISVLDAINNIYSDFPSYGYRRMTKQLQRDGCNVGKKFVKKAMYPKGISSLCSGQVYGYRSAIYEA